MSDPTTEFTGISALYQALDPITRRRVTIAIRAFASRWSDWTYPLSDGSRAGLPMPRGWGTKVTALSMLGATEEDWLHAVDTAMSRASVREQDRVFPYMLGIVWNRLISLDSHPAEAWGGSAEEVNGRAKISAPDRPAAGGAAR